MLKILTKPMSRAKRRGRKAPMINHTKILLILYIHVNYIYFARVLGEEEPIDKN